MMVPDAMAASAQQRQRQRIEQAERARLARRLATSRPERQEPGGSKLPREKLVRPVRWRFLRPRGLVSGG